MSKLSKLSIEVTDEMIKELRQGWKQLKTGDMEDLTFDDYLSACILYGHWNIHKCLGLMVIMSQKSHDNRKAKKE